jgi:23S rRNA pseudouridine1911/1915/1917 synthase
MSVLPVESDPGPLEEEPATGPAGPAGAEHHAFQADAGDVGERLDRVLALRVPGHSRARLTQLVDEGRVTVDGRGAKPSQRLKAGQQVMVEVPAPVAAEPLPQELPLCVLFQDADLVVVDKAAGMVVHPAAGAPDGTLVNALLFHVRDLSGIGGTLRPGIVHRLDKDTSGVMVVAKHERSLVALQRAFHDREVEKVYLALVHGVPPAEGTIDTLFGRHPTDRVRMTGRLSPGAPDARRAVTHYRVTESFGADAALVEVRLETGRTHQIRVHLSEAGFPLLGDETYGGTKRDRRAPERVRRAAERAGRQALHAWRLTLAHPMTRMSCAFEAPLPSDFAAALEMLRAAGRG